MLQATGLFIWYDALYRFRFQDFTWQGKYFAMTIKIKCLFSTLLLENINQPKVRVGEREREYLSQDTL